MPQKANKIKEQCGWFISFSNEMLLLHISSTCSSFFFFYFVLTKSEINSECSVQRLAMFQL